MTEKTNLDAPEFYAKDRAAWRKWLADNHERQRAVWLIYDKGKNRTMAWEDIVQEALCFGWIDSRPGKVSPTQSKIYICRRKPKSVWSKINKNHIAELTAKGLMTPAGQKVIDEAKANRSWNALDKSDNLEIPSELIELLEKNSVAKENFYAFSESSKRIILAWIYSAKTEPTRRKRIEETVNLASRGLKAGYPKNT